MVLAERLIRAIQLLETNRDEFDVIFLYIPCTLVGGLRRRSSGEDFDLHDHLKASHGRAAASRSSSCAKTRRWHIRPGECHVACRVSTLRQGGRSAVETWRR